MDRLQAVALFKELAANGLVEPSYVSLFQIEANAFQIQIKGGNKTELMDYAKKFGLTIEEAKEGKYLVIYKP